MKQYQSQGKKNNPNNYTFRMVTAF